MGDDATYIRRQSVSTVVLSIVSSSLPSIVPYCTPLSSFPFLHVVLYTINREYGRTSNKRGRRKRHATRDDKGIKNRKKRHQERKNRRKKERKKERKIQP